MAAPKSKKKANVSGLDCVRDGNRTPGAVQKCGAYGRARRAPVACRAEDARRARDAQCVCKAQRAFGPLLLVLRFLAVPGVERALHILLMSFLPCVVFCHLSLRHSAPLVYITTPVIEVFLMVEYVFYAVRAPVVEYVILAVAYAIRELFTSLWLGVRLFFNDVAHDVLRASHLRAVPLR